MKNKLFIPKDVDVTQNKEQLITISHKYLDGSNQHAFAIFEENVVGFRYIIISTNDGFEIHADTEHNKKVNPNVEIDVEEFSTILARWPKISLDSFRYAPITDYTAHITYFNHDIVKDLQVDYPPEGMFITDIIPHETGMPLIHKHKNNFMKTMGFVGLPLLYAGLFNEGYSRLDALSAISAIASNNLGNGVRITFEPRIDNSIFYLHPTSEAKKEINLDTPQTFVEELANYIMEPKYIMDVYKRKNKHPRSQRKLFTKIFVKTMEQDMKDLFNEYFNNAHVLLESYTYEKFLSDVEIYIYKHNKEMINQIKDL